MAKKAKKRGKRAPGKKHGKRAKKKNPKKKGGGASLSKQLARAKSANRTLRAQVHTLRARKRTKRTNGLRWHRAILASADGVKFGRWPAASASKTWWARSYADRGAVARRLARSDRSADRRKAVQIAKAEMLHQGARPKKKTAR